jgi:hypothetical protein
MKAVGDHVIKKKINGIFAIGDFLASSYGSGAPIEWRPWQSGQATMTQLGLDAQGNPVNDQVWATFSGRMGASYSTDLYSEQDFAGNPVSQLDKDFVIWVWILAEGLHLIPADLQTASGPGGPSDPSRKWIRPL